MICVGIESTAHTIGVGVVSDEQGRCRIHANVWRVYRPKKGGGIHPREAANHHSEVVAGLVEESLKRAKMRGDDIDVVAFSQGPGLGPCLRTGATAARALALSWDVPLVGVNHCVAHLEIGRGLLECSDPVLLYTSGANTQVIGYARGRYRVFGETLDIGVGNCLDKFGRSVGLGFPAGPEIEQLAKQGSRYVELPYSIKGMDVAFSGLLTAAEQLVKRKKVCLEDVCFSVQETVFAMLTEVTERAMAHSEKEEVLLGGGVACNQRLREMVSCMAEERGARCVVPPSDVCVDNGAMIAWLGLVMFKSGIRTAIEESVVDQRFRTDMVEVSWR